MEADFSLENLYNGNVCGIDEVGRGPLAGPVVAACVMIPANMRGFEFITYINDSKKLSQKKRDMLLYEIDLYSTLLPVTPCFSTKINLLVVKINTSLISLNPSSTCSSSINNLPYSFTKSSWSTAPALPSNAENKPIIV